ncbi:hypothetical protein TNCV_234851 [Trichonephila clavipes]|uniref:Uncharacterized protein n=1 Tax=Trichonephila clavipes TaxID=2585209 RepID=A0A8X6SNR7_TRICX|nr:hypothetical protein TNCV_234851 [Trichonephila clavipes]
MEMKEKNAWDSFKLVVTGFLENKKKKKRSKLQIFGCNIATKLQNIGLQHECQSPFPPLTSELLSRKSWGYLGGQFTGPKREIRRLPNVSFNNRLWHELCDMLRHLVGTTAPGHPDCSIQE